MRVYVAGRWTSKARVREVQAMLRAQGHSITHNWTVCEDPPAEWSRERTAAYLAEQAHDDLVGVMDADAIVVLDDPTGRGPYVELGIALADPRKRIMVVGEPRSPVACVFYFLRRVEYHARAEDAVAALCAAESAA